MDEVEEAIEEAAQRMAAWRRHRLRGEEAKRVYGAAKSTGEPPDQPLIDLRERGVIDAAEEATLTARAYVMSMDQ